jgi:Fe-S oxidoreductase
MNIALIIVLGGDLVKSTEHVGVGYLASCLRNDNHVVDIYEIRSYLELCQNKTFSKMKYQVCGFTTTCITIKSILNIAQKLKEDFPEVNILMGGHMATYAGEEIMKRYEQVNFIINGEGEITICELANAIEKDTGFDQIKGIIYREGDRVIRNEDRELICDLDVLPYPARDQFESNQKNMQYLRISSSRGCYGNCAFCSNFVGRTQKGKRWRGRSPVNIVDEIELLVNKYNFHTFDFVDSTFEDPGDEGKERIKEIAEEILKRKLTIYYNCCFRAENWKDEDHELLQTLVDSGLEKVNIGFESGNEKGLRTLNKRANMNDNWKVIKTLSNFPDIYITFGFIMLHPYSTKQDLLDNAKFLHDTGIGQVIRHYFWQLEVYPDTLMEKKLLEDKLLLSEYGIEDGMYQYRFQNPEVEVFANIFKELLEVQSIWEFEIFDIIIHTFISRLRKQEKGQEDLELIEDFYQFVQKCRTNMQDYNYNFFLNIINHYDEIVIKEEKCILDSYIKSMMEEIKKKQYQLGHRLIKRGIKLVGR